MARRSPLSGLDAYALAASGKPIGTADGAEDQTYDLTGARQR